MRLTPPDLSIYPTSVKPFTDLLEQTGERWKNQDIGQAIQKGGYKGGSDRALQYGELDAGVKLAGMGEDQTRRKQADMLKNIEGMGKRAQAAHYEKDPARRAMIWTNWLENHKRLFPGEQLSPEEMDPMTGPGLAMAEAGIAMDPRDDRMKDLNIKKAEAELAKLNSQSKYGGDAPSNVREWQYYQGLVPEQQQQYLTMKRAQQTFDLGTSYGISDPTRPGQLQGQVPKDVAGAEQQKTIGRETGERQMAAPKAKAAVDAFDAKSDVVLKTVADAKKMVGSLTAGFGGAVLSRIPGTAARDLSAKIDTLKANAGFNELQAMRDNSPTGGALGQVAVQELQMLQATITSLEQAQTPQQLMQALDAYETFVRESKVRRKLAFDMTYGGMAQPQQPAAQPRTIDLGDGFSMEFGQ